MAKKPRRLGRSCLVSDPAPNDDDDKSAHRQSQLHRASWQSPRLRTPKPSPSAGLLALLASFVTSTIPPAHAAPLPVAPNARRTNLSPDTIPTPIYLDFLYPQSRSQEQQAPQAPSHVPERLSDPPRRRKRPRAATSSAHNCGCVIPLKFEQSDTGWMIAERWSLHGKTALAAYIPISSIRPSMDSPVSLDLPTGWNSTTTNRPARYDPNIVIVFAIFLACGITVAIAATVWRNQRLRTKKLKADLERATKSKRRRTADELDSVDSDAGAEEEKSREQMKKKRRRRKASGSGAGAVVGGATKSSSTFWRPSSRFVGRLRFRSRRHKPAEVSAAEPPIATPRPASASPQPHPPHREDFTSPPVILVTTEQEQDSSSRVHSRHPSHVHLSPSPTVTEDPDSSETQPEPEGIPASSVSTLPVDSTHSVDQDQSILGLSDDIALHPPPTVEGYTSNPPAYLGMGNSWTPRHVEKTPLPGLEAEYDERDLEQFAAGSASTSPRPRLIVRSALESDLGMQPSPLQSRVYGVHVATDDKAELARLHLLADQPDSMLPPAEALPISDAPTVPEFGMVDDWYMETQLEQVSPDQPSSPTPTHNQLTLPPPPEPYLFSRHSPRHDTLAHNTSYHDTHDMNEAYTFSRLWRGTTPPLGPSAPPMETPEDDFSRGLQRDQHLQGLVPSAPPLLDGPISSAHLPSAPVFWDTENETYEPPGDSVPSLATSSGSPLGDEPPESTPGSSREDAGDHSDLQVRWVQQRQVDMEGIGLPKYEP